MAAKNNALSPQLKALKTTDLSMMIRMSGMMLPRLLGGFLPKLNERQREAVNKVMPVGGGKKMYIHLAGTPTPPIVTEMAQPLKINVMSESDVKQQQIKGITLTIDDLQLLMGNKSLGNMLKLFWRLKGQLGTMLGMSAMFMPLAKLGPGQLKDMKQKAMTHFKPMLDLMPR